MGSRHVPLRRVCVSGVTRAPQCGQSGISRMAITKYEGDDITGLPARRRALAEPPAVLESAEALVEQVHPS